MKTIAGLQIEKTSKGKIKSVTLNMKRWGYLMEDVLDAIAAVKGLKEDTISWEVVKAKLDKKHK